MGISDLMNPKQIYDLVKKKAQLEAQEEIMKYRKLVLNQNEEIQKLKQQNSSLKAKLELKSKIKKSDKGLYLVNDEGEQEGPYCVRCYEVTDTLISLRKIEYDHRYYYVCSEFKQEYDRDESRITF